MRAPDWAKSLDDGEGETRPDEQDSRQAEGKVFLYGPNHYERSDGQGSRPAVPGWEC